MAHTGALKKKHTGVHTHVHKGTHAHTYAHAQIVGNVAGRREHLRIPPNTPAAHEPFTSLTMRCLSYDVAQRPAIEEVVTCLEEMAQGPLYV